MNKRKMMGVAAMAVAAMTITTVGGVSVYADDDINATVIWRAFDDQFQSGFESLWEMKKKTSVELNWICRMLKTRYL